MVDKNIKRKNGFWSNFRFIFSCFALNIKKEWQYKSSFFMQIIMMILNDLFFIIQWYIIFNIVDNIGGYGFYETMLLWAVSAGGFGFSYTLFGGAWNLKDIVYEGKLDVYLTQPKNALINVCCSSTNISAIGDIIYAFVVLIIIGAPWWWYFVMIPVMIISGIIYVSVYITFCSLCFYIKRGDSVAYTIESQMLKFATYPPAIYNFTVKVILFTIIPAFFFTFIPTQYFFLTFNIWWVLGTIGVMIFWVMLAFVSFHFGLRRYNSGNLMNGRL